MEQILKKRRLNGLAYVDVVPEHLLEMHVIPCLDMLSLMHLCGTSQRWRSMLQKESVIHRWQKECWYVLDPECAPPCRRHMTYLNLVDFCGFLWSWSGTVNSNHEMHLVLRDLGRPFDSLCMNLSSRFYDEGGKIPTEGWEPGMFVPGFESLIIPLPRFRGCDAQQMRVSQVNHKGESVPCPIWDEEHVIDIESDFWFEHHRAEKPEENVYEMEECSEPLTVLESMEYAGSGDEQRCAHQLECTHSLQQLGCQGYCMSQCLTDGQLLYLTVGDEPVDWVFLHGDDEDFERQKLMYVNGFVYFVGVCYENGSGDVFNWCRGMYTLKRWVLWRVWRECMIHLVQYVRRYCLELCEVMETHVDMDQFRQRTHELYQWQYDMYHGVGEDKHVSVGVLENNDYRSFWMLLRGITEQNVPNHRNTYLSMLIPAIDQMVSTQLRQGRIHRGSRYDRHLCLELSHMLQLGCFLVHLKEHVIFGGPDGGILGESPSTRLTDRLAFRLYLQQAIGLLARSPGWLVEGGYLCPEEKKAMRMPMPMHPSHTHTSQRQRRWLAEFRRQSEISRQREAEG